MQNRPSAEKISTGSRFFLARSTSLAGFSRQYPNRVGMDCSTLRALVVNVDLLLLGEGFGIDLLLETLRPASPPGYLIGPVDDPLVVRPTGVGILPNLDLE